MKTRVIPEQYRTGSAYFMDFEFAVTPDVLIPRPETELVVERVRDVIRGLPGGDAADILDIGTGSGNIAISLTKYCRASTIVALDISRPALDVARRNAHALGVNDRVTFITSDLFEAIPAGTRFDVIVSNPPYISDKDMPGLPDEVKAEPTVALYGGPDGLSLYRRIVRQADRVLRAGGWIVFEVGYDQAQAVAGLLAEHGFCAIRIDADHAGIDRIVSARLGSADRGNV